MAQGTITEKLPDNRARVRLDDGTEVIVNTLTGKIEGEAVRGQFIPRREAPPAAPQPDPQSMAAGMAGPAGGLAGAPGLFSGEPLPPGGRRVASAATEAAIGGLQAGPAGAVAGALGGAAFPGDEGASAASAAGETLMRGAANRLVPGGGVVSRMARGGMRAAGAGVGFGVGQSIQENFLGKPANNTAGINMFITPITVGAASIAGSLIGTGGAAMLKHFENSPTQAVIRAANRVKPGQFAEEDFGLIGAQARIGQSAAKAGARVERVGRRVLNELFPVEIGLEDLQRTITRTSQTFEVLVEGQRFKGALAGETFEALKGKSKLAQSIRDRLNLSADDLTAFEKAFDGPPEQFLDTLFKGDLKSSGRRLNAFKQMAESGGFKSDFDEIANEWVKRELVGRAMVESAPGAAGRVLSGEAFNRNVLEAGETLNRVFGDDRAEALTALGRLMSQRDPAKVAKSTFFARQGTSNLLYFERHAVFAASVGGLASGGTALVAGLPAAATIGAFTIGVVPLALEVIKDPTVTLRLGRALEDPTGAALRSFWRALSSGDRSEQTVESLPVRAK